MAATVRTNGRQTLTLKDRLSHLTYTQACRLLGRDGKRLVDRGGRYEINLVDDVELSDARLRVRVVGAWVTIAPSAAATYGLSLTCSRCTNSCEHLGGALALVLEEKLALGLAAPPPERVRVESLDEETLIRAALDERRERARTERFSVRSTNPRQLWTDYLVTSAASGKTYRVALRGWEPGDSYCACPDFRKNTLGVCKHVLCVQDRVRAKFPARVRNRPHAQREIAVHVRYGRDLELRLLAPAKLPAAVVPIVRPLRDRPITDVHDLLDRARRLESLGHAVTVYPDAEELIQRQLHQERIAALVADIRRRPKSHPLRTGLLKSELLPYQLDGIAFAVGAGRAILADDMGLGKTIQGVGVAELLAREADIRKVLVVCPASLKSQWRNEIRRFSERGCQLVLGGAAERARQYRNDAFFTICNYEQVLRDILAIEAVPWDLIILDEGQRIKNWEAKTSRVIKGLRSRFALVLSGTPLENRLEELYSVAEFVDERRLGPAFRFLNQHRVVDEKGKVLAYKNLAQLRERLRPILLRRTRAGVMRDLPPRTTDILRIAPTEEQLDLHDANKRIISQILSKHYLTEMDLLRLRKALLLCRMAADSTYLVTKEPPGWSSKLESLDELLESSFAGQQRKAVLFSEWTTMLDLIEPLLKRHRLPFVRLDGSVPQKKRQELVNAFQNGGDARLFITTNAGASGLNLQAADTVINVDLPWNPAVLEQRIARAHRMGQKRPVHVFVLVTEQTIEEGMLRTLAAKHDLAQAALDIDSDVDSVDLVGGIDELKRRLEQLLGQKPAAPLDQSELERQRAAAEQQERRDRVALAGGQLLGAAFTFLGQLLPAQEHETEASHAMSEAIRGRLTECLEADEQGRPRLSVTLPDAAAVDQLAASLARLLSVTAGSAAGPAGGR